MAKKIVLFLFLVGGAVAGFYFAKVGGGVHLAAAVDKAEFVASAPNVIEKETASQAMPDASAQGIDETPASRISKMMALLDDNARNLYRSTWLHLKEERIFDIDIPNNGVLPNGEAIPLHQINDVWYQIDDAGNIVTTLMIMHDANGHVVQVGGCKNGVSWNSATKDSGNCAPVSLQLDGGFQHEMQWLTSKGAVVVQEGESKLPESSRTGYQVVLVQKWASPLHADAYAKGVVSATDKALFDVQNGHLVEWQTIFRFEDGSERVYRRIRWKIAVSPLSSEAKKFLEAFP